MTRLCSRDVVQKGLAQLASVRTDIVGGAHEPTVCKT